MFISRCFFMHSFQVSLILPESTEIWLIDYMLYVLFQIPGNDQLFYGDSSYSQELVSISNLAAQKLVDAIQREPSSVSMIVDGFRDYYNGLISCT